MASFFQSGQDRAETPATSLGGLILNERWKVGEMRRPPPQATGGHFSVGYLAEDTQANGHGTVFLKALDFSAANQASDPLLALNQLTEAYLFERDVLLHCKDGKHSRVAVPLDHGHVQISGFGDFSQVNFLVFPLAKGDLRTAIDNLATVELRWKFRVLHNACVGLSQLHKAGVIHQDLKPSNVLVFEEESQKVGDLGRASSQRHQAPHEGCIVPGDLGYAPHEMRYRLVDDQDARRRGLDMYLLGSFMLYLLTGANTTAVIDANAPQGALPRPGTHVLKDQVMPVLEQIFDEILRLLREHLKELYRPSDKLLDKIIATYRELAHPDHVRRGQPGTKVSNSQKFNLEKYVTRFDLLRSMAELDR